MGFISTSAIVMVQDNVGWSKRGAATASNIFSRNLGSTLGATVLGEVLNLSLSMGGPSGPVDAEQIQRLLDHPVASASDAVVRAALDLSLHYTFWGVFLISVLTLLFATLAPVVTINPRPQDPPRK